MIGPVRFSRRFEKTIVRDSRGVSSRTNKKTAASAKGGCFYVLFQVFGKQVPFTVKPLLRGEVSQPYDDRLAGVFCQVPLISVRLTPLLGLISVKANPS